MFPIAKLKWNAVVESVGTMARQNRAVLIGTRSVEASEHVGGLLSVAGLDPVNSTHAKIGRRRRSLPLRDSPVA